MHSKIAAVRRIQFCSGHRVYKHESKCANLHGHNYVAFIHAEAEDLDSIGRVIDFSVLKEKVGGWIDKHWDHTMILWAKDEDARFSVGEVTRNKDIFVLPSNPTAENMANYLLNIVCPDVLSGTGVDVVKIVLWETENCNVEVTKNK